MHRIVSLIFILACSTQSFADEGELNLACSISTSGFAELKDDMQFADVQLSGQKHTTSGAKQVFVIADHEFWVMNHAIQTIADKSFVLNFQVAIKNRQTSDFIHALSNSRDSSDPMSARISLVNYTNNMLWEDGEIMFECREKA